MLAREILRRVREIQVRTGRQVADVLGGEYVSVFRGRGIEFDEVRPYLPGDDVRTIDWNVTARTGAPYVKRYVEERQLTLMLMADVSASEEFGSGSRSKREAAAEFCALLAFSAIRHDDKVGLTLFHDGIEQYIPPRKGQKHALRVVREVLAHEPTTTRKPGTHLAGALEFLLSVTKRKSVCFLVSDFLDEGWHDALLAANRKHDVIPVLITDPRELEIPPVGLLTLEDAETGEVRVIDASSAAFRREHARQAAERVDALRRRFHRAGIDFIHVDAAASVVEPLVRFFRMRERRMRR
ncbi:MAG: DUF58 domain-containing protein [Myxococcota bacterium]|nr:DUF58 domain-containing protein [Myxococcota bacterium]